MTEFKDDADSLVKLLIRDDVRAMSAYHVQDAAGLIKLDAMENPYPWPGDLSDWQQILGGVQVNRYPDSRADQLVERVREVMDIPARYQVLPGNGSDEIIQLLIQAVAGNSVQVVVPEPSFVMYRVLADINRVPFQGVPLLPDFQLDVPAVLETFKAQQSSLVFLACPNNPTGICYSEADMRQIIEACPGLVVVDEAYIAFTERDALPLLDEYPNLLVMRTLSKVGLAGLRIGMLIGDPRWVREIDKLRLPYNVNALSQRAVEVALRHYQQLDGQARQVRQDRELLLRELQSLPLDQVWPSQANFILVRTDAGRAGEVFDGLRARGVLIKCLDGAHPLLRDCLRITVGSPDENASLLQNLRALL